MTPSCGCRGAIIQPLGLAQLTVEVDLAKACVAVHVVSDSSQKVRRIIGQPGVVVIQCGGRLWIIKAEESQFTVGRAATFAKAVAVSKGSHGYFSDETANVQVMVKM